MTWNSAFPSSPLSRSALQADAETITMAGTSRGGPPPQSMGPQSSPAQRSLITNTKLGFLLPSPAHTASRPGQIAHSAHDGPESSSWHTRRRVSSGSSSLTSTPRYPGSWLSATAPDGSPSPASDGFRQIGSLSPRQGRNLSHDLYGTVNPASVASMAPWTSGAGTSTASLSPQFAHQRRRSSGHSLSTTPTNFGSLIGSYEESLLSGRMSTVPSRPFFFDAELGVLGIGKGIKPSLKCPRHVGIRFPAQFYDLKANTSPSGGPSVAGLSGGSHSFLTGASTDTAALNHSITSSAGLGTPYVGTIDLDGHYLDELLAHSFGADVAIESNNPASGSPPVSPVALSTLASLATAPSFPGYRVPPKGQVQLIIKNPNLTAVKVFLVPYDLTDMPPGTKTFIRQKSYIITDPQPVSAAVSTTTSTTSPVMGSGMRRMGGNTPRRPSDVGQQQQTLRYAVHLQFCATPVSSSNAIARKHRTRSGEDIRDTTSSRGHTSAPKIYLHRNIRVVFAARVPDKTEKLQVVTECPGGIISVSSSGQASSTSPVMEFADPEERERKARIMSEQRYSSYYGPSEEWVEAKRVCKQMETPRTPSIATRDGGERDDGMSRGRSTTARSRTSQGNELVGSNWGSSIRKENRESPTTPAAVDARVDREDRPESPWKLGRSEPAPAVLDASSSSAALSASTTMATITATPVDMPPALPRSGRSSPYQQRQSSFDQEQHRYQQEQGVMDGSVRYYFDEPGQVGHIANSDPNGERWGDRLQGLEYEQQEESPWGAPVVDSREMRRGDVIGSPPNLVRHLSSSMGQTPSDAGGACSITSSWSTAAGTSGGGGGFRRVQAGTAVLLPRIDLISPSASSLSSAEGPAEILRASAVASLAGAAATTTSMSKGFLGGQRTMASATICSPTLFPGSVTVGVPPSGGTASVEETPHRPSALEGIEAERMEHSIRPFCTPSATLDTGEELSVSADPNIQQRYPLSTQPSIPAAFTPSGLAQSRPQTPTA